MNSKIKILLLLLLVFACKQNEQRNQNETSKVLDSISKLITSAKITDKTNPDSDNLQTAYTLSTTLNDSARIRALSRIAYKYFVLNNSQQFLKNKHRIYTISSKNKRQR